MLQANIEAELQGLLRALKLTGFKVIITSDDKQLRHLGVGGLDMRRLRQGCELTGRATGGASPELKTIVIYGSPDRLADTEVIYAVLLHELGHIISPCTHDEVLAWDRGFDIALTVTPKMRAIRKQALATYDIIEEAA